MNVFFDYQAFALQNYGGISRYFCELITGINKTSVHNAHLSLLWSNNVYLKEYNFSTFSYPFPKKHRLLTKSNLFYNVIDANIKKYDIYHATYFDDFLKKIAGSKPLVTTFYDMTYERLSNQFADLSGDTWIIPQKKKIAQQASHLIAISESTKQDMVELLNVDPEKISVIYLGSSFGQNIDTASSINSSLDRPYLLYVGNRSGYKNFLPFLKAVANLLIRYDIDLICAGGGEFTTGEQEIIRALAVTNFVKFKAINDAILQDLYTGAVAFIFPSLYEGFGIPILEAFSCNCPCIVSNTSSLPEVAGDAAIYIDPTVPETMAVAVENIILNSDKRKELIEQGQLQMSKFSWQKTVNETLKLYEQLL